MRNWKILASIFALTVLCEEAKAGDKEDVLARMADFYSAVNSGDVNALSFTTLFSS